MIDPRRFVHVAYAIASAPVSDQPVALKWTTGHSSQRQNVNGPDEARRLRDEKTLSRPPWVTDSRSAMVHGDLRECFCANHARG